MLLQSDETDGIPVISLQGKIMGEPEDEIFIETILKLAEKGSKNVVLDLSGIGWMNSRGIGMCLKALNILRKEDGDLRLARLSKNARSLLEKCRLISVFKHYKTTAKAIKSFK